MKLLSLTLKNFKGIKNFTLDTQGGNVAVFGDNGTGKTTLFDSVTWLLFGKDSQNKASFDIKTLDGNNKAFTGLDHEVEGTFEISGRRLTLKKTFKEKWTKKKGSANKEFTGHTTDHYIDGVPVPEKDYTAKIAEIAREDVFKLLTNPTYFNTQLKWQDRRKILLEVCGDLTDSEVIASNEKLSKLPEILNGRKLEDHKKVIVARKAEINKELERIPVRIDETTQGLPDLTGVDANEISGKIATIKARIKEKNQEIARIQGGGEVAEKTKALREVEGRILDIKNRHREETEGKVQGKRTELSRLNEKIFSLQQSIKSNQSTIQTNANIIKEREAMAGRLREEWFQINDQQFEHNQECTCPTCGQQLPEEKLNEARDKALAAFNRDKAQRLEGITSAGKQRKAAIRKLQDESAVLEGKNTELQAELDGVQGKAAALKDEIDIITKGATDITENPAYIQAITEKESLEREIASLKEGSTAAIVPLRAEIQMLENEVAGLEKSLTQVDQYEKGQKRIEELKAQEKALAAEFEKLEGETFLVEEFVRAKVAMLEQKINGKFKYARFKLFNVLVNGGVEECCETLYNGVPYSSGLNNGHRGIVGLDIIATLSEHFNFYPPIFYDNAEAVTHLPEMKNQMVTLYVSEPDKKIRVEYENAMREAI